MKWLWTIWHRLAGPGKPLGARDPRWPALRRKWLESHPYCYACGGDEHLTVHHIVPVHVSAAGELDENNLITLCEHPTHNCHFVHAHKCDWRRYEPEIVSVAGDYRRRMERMP